MSVSSAESPAQRPKSLYIFARSSRADVYINSIGHCLGEHDRLEVVLVDILQDKGRKTESVHRLDEIRASIQRQLDALTRSEYLVRDGAKESIRSIYLEKYDVARYSQMRGVPLNTLVVSEDDLEKTVLEVARSGGIFDASAVSKLHLARLLAILAKASHRGLFVFELLRWVENRSFDERELIHSLIANRDYRFIDLVTENFQLSNVADLEGAYADDFASGVLMLAFFVLLFPTSIFGTAVFLLDWEKVEWLSFLLFGLPLIPLLMYLAAALDIDLRLGPWELRQWARARAHRRLLKKVPRA